MAKQLTPHEAKQLPHWPQMNKFIKEMLKEHLGDMEYRVAVKEDVWEIWVDDQLFGMIGITEDDQVPTIDGKEKLN